MTPPHFKRKSYEKLWDGGEVAILVIAVRSNALSFPSDPTFYLSSAFLLVEIMLCFGSSMNCISYQILRVYGISQKTSSNLIVVH